MTLFETGIRPKIDEYLDKKAKERRDYGKYWSASSAGHCHRKVIFERLKVPYTSEDPRKQRVFEAGHIFHEWVQRITRDSGLSLAQELELQDNDLMIRGHIDDLVSVNDHLILYDYKTQNSRAFTWQKDKPISHFHKMQLGTYMKMIREGKINSEVNFDNKLLSTLAEGRILKISKDDLRMAENVLYGDDELESRVITYWKELNTAWKKYQSNEILPSCTCADYEGGFMASEKWNPFFYNGEPCSEAWLEKHKSQLVQK